MQSLGELRPFRADKIPPPPALNFDFAKIQRDFRHVELEIGSGVGFFAIDFSKQHPDKALIALEHTKSRFESFRRRIKNHRDPPNLFAYQANAISFVTHLLPIAGLDQIYLHYPNPNPKNPALRWMRMPFCAELVRVLKKGGELRLVTNEEWYYREALAAVEKYWPLEILSQRSFTLADVPGGKARTHFEKKYLLAGQSCYQLDLRKNDV